MPISSTLRINMTGICDDPADESERYRAALDMAVYAEEQGFDTVNFEEHHCAENGWLPAPLTMAAMVIARTERIRVNVAALLVTLYDPIRLAEEIAILDLVSRGRFSFVAGIGYRPIEYHAVGKSWADRGRLLDECVDTLLNAWSGEAFEYRGKTIRVTPVPMSRPTPFFFLGGMSKVSARRAARYGIPYFPAIDDSELEACYHAELAKHGKQGFYMAPGRGNSMTVVDPDPERAWAELGPYYLRELREYSSWKRAEVRRPGEGVAETVEDVRHGDRFEILTPEACRARAEAGEVEQVCLHPLAGGVPVERAWEILRRYTEEVHRPLAPL